jgi:hypothetical protein
MKKDLSRSARERIEQIRSAVEETERCRATHIQSFLVKERLAEDTPVEIMVETFELHNHPKTKRVYAWQRWLDGKKGEPKYTIMLGIPPVNSANDAVKAMIAAIWNQL